MYRRFYSAAALGVFLLVSGAAQAQTISLKKTNIGILTQNDPFDNVRQFSHRKVYVGFLSAGKTYTFHLNSLKFDPYLRIETMNGFQVAFNDDGGFGLNSKLTFSPQFSGNYRIIVTTFKPHTTGGYVLNYSSVNGGGGGGGGIPDIAWLNPGNNFGALTFNDQFDTIRKQSRRKVYQLNMTAGNTYIIDMESQQFDTFLRLENQFGKVLAVDDDGGQGLNARIVHKAQFSGTYRVIATSFGANKTGSFNLKLGVLGNGGGGGGGNQFITGALTFNDAKDFTGRRYDTHTRFLMAGKTYTIRMNSNAFDTLLKLKSPSGQVVAVDDDGGVGLNSLITFTPAFSGMYQIVATSYSANKTGPYTISVVGQ